MSNGSVLMGAEMPDESLGIMSLSDRVFQRIEAMILSGKLKAGERLNDSRLAQSFSTSRGPVRNALVRLSEAGLVEIIPYRGAFVRELDLNDVLEIYEVRAAIERAGVLAACRNMTPGLQAKLQACAKDMDESVASNDRERYFTLNLSFHQLLHQASGNRRLQELYERYTREQKLYRHFSLMTVGIHESNKEHQRIIRALLQDDGPQAAQYMEHHVLSARDRLATSVRQAQSEQDTDH